MKITIIDKFVQGKDTMEYLDGGAALHANLEDYPTKETCRSFLNIAVKTGCNYFCTNVKVTFVMTVNTLINALTPSVLNVVLLILIMLLELLVI